MTMTTPQEIERCVLVASDASNLEYQQQANALLNQWVSSNSDVVLADAIVEVVRATKREVVLFYALTVYSRLDNASPHQRSIFRQEILSQLLDSSANFTPTTTTTTASNNYHQSSWSPTYLRTKVGVLFAHFIRLDYPQAWSAFDELQAPRMLHGAPDILLRTLVALMEEFGKDETEVNTKIKDYLRGYTNMQQPNDIVVADPRHSISGQLIQTILSLLERALAETNGQREEQTQIVILALTVLKGCMSWVDIVLLMEERVLQLIFAALARGSATKSDLSDAGVLAVGCMEELIARGMEDEKKISILRHTGILEKIHAHVDLITVDASPIDVVLEVSKFINRTGLEVLPIIHQQSEQETNLKAQILELFFRCFAYDDIDVSGAVIPLAGTLLSEFDQQAQLHQQPDGQLPKLLAIIYAQMRYPPDFQYDFEDDDEAEEELYRTELRKLNQKCVRANPELCLQFTCEALSQLPLPLSTAPTPYVEAAINLVYQYCEGIRPPPGMKVVMRSETFRNLLAGLHSSDITQHPHREVLALYYETSVRYYPLLKERPDLLQKVLEALTGPRGLQHEHPRLRSRCCYLLLRIVKSMGSNNNNNSNNVLRPYVETAVSGILRLLESSESQLRSEDTLNLFETIGLLLGKTGLSPSEQQQYLTQVMTPHVCSIETILNENKQAISQDPDMYGEILSGSIAAIAFISKGFKQPPQEVQTVLLEALKAALSVLEVLPNNEQVRNKTYVLIQRLIQCLEEKVLASMPRVLYLVVTHCTTVDVLDVAQLMNQLCIKFKEEAVGALDSSLLPFLQKCCCLSNTVILENSSSEKQLQEEMNGPHLRIEQLSIQKLSYAVLQHVVVHRATPVLISTTNVASLEVILQSMSEGAVHVEDPIMKKSCLVFFRGLLDQWVVGAKEGNNANTANAPEYVIQGYVRFICDVLIPGMLQLILGASNNSFNVDDANHFRCLVEFSGILEIIKTRLPELFYQEVVVAKMTTRFGLSQPMLEGFRSACTRKEFEASLKAMIEKGREQQ